MSDSGAHDEDEDEDEDEEDEGRGAKKPPPKGWPAWLMVTVALAIPVFVVGAYAGYKKILDLRDRPEKGVTMATKPLQTRKPWIDEGYFEIVPPIRMPASFNGRSRIEDWMKIPAGQKLSAKYLEAQKRWSLVYPTGTIVDRLELPDGEHVADVRGTELTPEGQHFHVYRRHNGILRGYIWKRDDAEQQEEATRVLVAHAKDFENAPPRELEGLKNNNGCGPCHAFDREPDRKLVRNRPNRGTDSAGFFMPDTTLADRAPIEVHRPREMNVDDEIIKFHCFDDAGNDTPVVMVSRPDKTLWPSCADETVPIGVVDVPSGLKANEIHVTRLCASRKELYGRMDDVAKKAFADAFKACNIGG